MGDWCRESTKLEDWDSKDEKKSHQRQDNQAINVNVEGVFSVIYDVWKCGGANVE